jgi:Na+-driven multidrug efflux pump
MNFLNSIGKVKIQMWLYVFGAIINIPLSILFVTSLNLGSTGVIVGTIISIISLSLILPIQTHQILKNK